MTAASRVSASERSELSLLKAAFTCADEDAAKRVASMPTAAWTHGEFGQVASIIRQLRERGDKVTSETVWARADEMLREFLPDLMDLRGASLDNAYHERAILDAYHWRERNAKLRLLGRSPETLSDESFRVFVEDGLRPHLPPLGALEPTNVLASGDLPMPVFTRGFARGEVGEATGPSNIGKGWMALGIGGGVATGETILPSLGPNITGTVLMFSYEDGAAQLGYRIRALERLSGAPVCDAVREGLLQFFPNAEPLFTQASKNESPVVTDYFRRVEDLAARVKPVLIIFDPASVAFGLLSENDPAIQTHLVQELCRFARRFNVAVLFTSHTSQAMARTPGIYAGRGATGTVARIDWSVQMVAESTESVMVHFNKVRNGGKPAALVLTRTTRGPFAEVPKETRRPEVLVNDVVSFIAENADKAVALRGIGRRTGDGRDLADAIANAHNWATPKHTQMAAQMAIDAGRIVEVEEPRSATDRHKRKALRPSQNEPDLAVVSSKCP